MTDTFHAAVLTALNKPLEIWELKIPRLERGQVLVKNLASGICRSQLMESTGMRGEDKWLPHLLGHEGVGEVQAVGPDVTKVQQGDIVVTSWIPGDGIQSSNPKYLTTSGNQVNSGSATTFSEFSVVSENRVFPAPQGFPMSFLPQFGCALLTGGGMVVSTLNGKILQKGTRVLVLGFGGVGTAAALVLKSYPELEIVIIEKSVDRQQTAIDHGFKDVYSSITNYSESNKYQELNFDYCFESAGSVESIQTGFNAIADQGTLVFASHPPKGDLVSLDPFDFIKGKTIKGTWGGDTAPEQAMLEIGNRLSKVGVNYELMTGPKFSLEAVNDGLSYLATGGAGKPILIFGAHIDAN